MPVTLSIIIVHYNVAQHLEQCLLSIQRFAKGVTHEVIVVDNASPNKDWKKLIPQFSSTNFLVSDENLGFSKANNLGVKHAHGKYILLLNPDTEFLDDSIEKVIHFAEKQEKLGCIGVRLVDANHQFHPESKRSVPNLSDSFTKLFFPKKQNARGYYRNDIPQSAIAPVEVVTGAYLLCEKEKYQRIGGLDEAYFMYGEDIDLCYTFLQHGYTNWYYGASTVLHYKGESTVKDEVYLERFYGAMQIFSKKYHYPQSKLKYLLVLLGLRIKRWMAERKLHKAN